MAAFGHALRRALSGLARNEVAEHDEATDETDDEDSGDQHEAALDEIADRCAEPGDEHRQQIEPDRAADDRCEAKLHEIEVKGAARNGDNFVWDRRHALDDDDPDTPAAVELLQRQILL